MLLENGRNMHENEWFCEIIEKIKNPENSLAGSNLVPSIDRIASVSGWYFLCLKVAEIAAFQGFQEI
jgi:hypothetical protein